MTDAATAKPLPSAAARPEAWVAAAGETVDVRALIRRTVTTAATRATAG